MAVGSGRILAAAELSGDALDDVVVWDLFNDAELWIADGLGGFTTDTVIDLGVDEPWGLWSAHANGDADVDLVASRLTGDVSVFLGDGAGGISTTIPFAADAAVLGMAAADLTGDGLIDLVVNLAGPVGPQLGIYPNDGAGSYGAGLFMPLNVPAIVAPSYGVLAVEDFDGDGELDVATSGAVFYGAERFATPFERIIAGDGAYGVVSRDFDGNGTADLAISLFGESAVEVFSGQGNGAFVSLAKYGVNALPATLGSADFNGDTHFDLFTINTGGSGDMSVLLGVGDGTFTGPTHVALATGVFRATVGDVNRDGNLDVAAASTFADEVVVVLGDGAGGFPNSIAISVENPLYVAAGQLSPDANLDLVVTRSTNDSPLLLLGDRTGSFTSQVLTAASTTRKLAVADLNADGRAELLAAGVSDSTLLIWTVDTLGGLVAVSPVPVVDGFNEFEIADVDGDGHVDLLSSDGDALWVQHGDGGFGFGAATGFVGAAGDQLAVADFDGNGVPDVAMTDDFDDLTVILLGQ